MELNVLFVPRWRCERRARSRTSAVAAEVKHGERTNGRTASNPSRGRDATHHHVHVQARTSPDRRAVRSLEEQRQYSQFRDGV